MTAEPLITAFHPPYAPDEAYFSRQIKKSRELLDCLERGYRDASTTIHPQDAMWVGLGDAQDINNYMFSGRTALKCVVHALLKADSTMPRTILDFPCGHGRGMRFFRAAFPQAKIYGGEIDRSGLEFCVSEFGAIPIESATDFRDVKFPVKFDVIFVGSLATHLSQDKVISLFDSLIDALDVDGVLAISTIGRMYARFVQKHKYKVIDDTLWDDLERSFDISGFGYADYPGVQGYGITLISPTWIVNYLKNRDDVTLMGFSEKDWCGQHDVAYIRKRPLSHWITLTRD